LKRWFSAASAAAGLSDEGALVANRLGAETVAGLLRLQAITANARTTSRWCAL